VEGMDFLESNRPSPEIVMPLIKSNAVAAHKYPPQAILHVASAPEMAAAIETADESPISGAPEVPLHQTPAERVAPPEASSALKALRDALAGAASRVSVSHGT